ncbi:MAG: ABC transporter permease, partial [Candidatus Omnitrophota bacterium]
MIEVKNISKTYRMGKVEVRALAGVSLNIAAGDFVAIMGPSGSGKSTLMHILGLLDRPDSGDYSFAGEELFRFSDQELAAVRNGLVGFVFQQFHLLPRMTALENVELPLVYAGKRHLREMAREKIELVGLKDRISHWPNELSGGQQQRVAIARALVNDPPVILADEPTGNLDSKSKEEIIAILKRLNQEGKTIIIVTHEREIAEYARRIIQMRDGRIVSDERMGEVSAKDSLQSPAGLVDGFVFKHPRDVSGHKVTDYFRQAGFAMLAHKMRSALSILGVLIGVAAVIAMLALGQGAQASIEAQLASLGSNLLVIRPGSPRMHGVAMESGAVARFTFQDVEAIRKLAGGVKRASPSVSGRGQMVYGSKNWNTQIEGVDVDYAQMRASVPAIGRFFTDAEVKMREKVVVLGTTVADELFGASNPLGETVKINLINFRVIGILPSKGANSFHDQDDIVLVPVTTAMSRLLGKEYVDTIYVEADNPQLLEPLTDSI